MDEANQTTNGEYYTLSTGGKVPSGAKMAYMYVLIRGNGGIGAGTIYADLLNFHYGEANSLGNGSFEDYSNQSGLADGWNKVAWGGAVETIAVLDAWDAPAGSKVQRIQARNIPDGNYAAIIQKIKVEEGKTFTASGRFKIEELKNAKLQYYIDFLSEPGKYVGASIVEATQTTNGEYFTLSTSGKVPSGAKIAYVYVLIRENGGIGAGTVYADLLKIDIS